jgi:hypothetical protein
VAKPKPTHLDPEEVVDTVQKLSRRIEERFKGRGIVKLGRTLTVVAWDAASIARSIARPNWGFRATITTVSLVSGWALVALLCKANVRDDFGGISDYIQGIQALAQILVYAGAIVFFLSSLELRRKRSRVLRALRDLRAFAHVVDMHQLTKDPERLDSSVVKGEDTESSPKREMTPFELTRYLNYCSELLSITSKIAAIYVQDFHDATSVDAASDIEDLTVGLSRKIWQKINIVNHLATTDG